MPAARRDRGRRALLRALAARADGGRSPSSAVVSTTCRWPSSLRLPARAPSRPSRSSSGCPSGSTCSRAAATPIRASRRSARRSSGATSSSRPRNSSSSPACPFSPAAARWRRPKKSAKPTSTRSSRSSRRVLFASPTSATGCWRRFGSMRGSDGRMVRGRCSPESTPATTGSWLRCPNLRSGRGRPRSGSPDSIPRGRTSEQRLNGV